MLNWVESFLHVYSMCKWMTDLSVNLSKLQIGCLYAGIIINHMMYADDLLYFYLLFLG